MREPYFARNKLQEGIKVAKRKMPKRNSKGQFVKSGKGKKKKNPC